MIAIQALEGGYGESPVLRGVALDVSRGEIFAILGKNGMGKTTLLKTIMGLLPAKKGRVELLGQDVTGWPPYRITRLGVSYVPQEKSIFQDLTVEENLRLALRDGVSFDARLETISSWFPVLKARLQQRAGTLSGGEPLLRARDSLRRERDRAADQRGWRDLLAVPARPPPDRGGPRHSRLARDATDADRGRRPGGDHERGVGASARHQHAARPVRYFLPRRGPGEPGRRAPHPTR